MSVQAESTQACTQLNHICSYFYVKGVKGVLHDSTCLSLLLFDSILRNSNISEFATQTYSRFKLIVSKCSFI